MSEYEAYSLEELEGQRQIMEEYGAPTFQKQEIDAELGVRGYWFCPHDWRITPIIPNMCQYCGRPQDQPEEIDAPS